MSTTYKTEVARADGSTAIELWVGNKVEVGPTHISILDEWRVVAMFRADALLCLTTVDGGVHPDSEWDVEIALRDQDAESWRKFRADHGEIMADAENWRAFEKKQGNIISDAERWQKFAPEVFSLGILVRFISQLSDAGNKDATRTLEDWDRARGETHAQK